MPATIILHGQQVPKEWFVRLKKAYDIAVSRKQEVFKMDGQDVLVSYAKYVIQYAEQYFGKL